MSLSNHPCLNSTKSPLLSTHDKEKLTVRSKSPQFLKPSDVHVASSFINCHGTINTPTSNPDTTSNARGKSKNITSISSSSTSNSRAINTCSTSMATSVAGSDPPSPPVASASSSSSSTSTCGGNIFIAVPPFPVTTVASNIASAVDASTSITTTASLPTATTSTYKTAVADSVIRQDDDTSAEDIYITAISYSSSSSGKRNVDPSCVHFNNITLANRVGTENSCCRLSPTTQESVEHSRCNSGRSNSPKSSTTCSTCTLSCSCSCNSSCTSKCYCNCTRSGSCVSSSFSHSPKKKSPQTSGRGIATTSTRESVNCDQETEASSSGLLTKAKSNIVKPKESVLTSSTPPADSGYCSCCFGKNSPTTHAETPVSFNASSSISTASLTSRAQNAGATSVSNCDTTVTKGEILVSGAKTPRTPLCSTGTTPSPPSPKRTTAVNSGKIGLGKGLLTSKPVQFASRQTGLQASPAKSAPSNGNPDGRKKNTVPTTHSSSPSKHRNHKLCFPKQIQQTRQQKSCAGITRRGSNVSNVSRSGGWKFNKMGNGSSHGGGGHVVIDGESLEVSRIKSLIPEMRRELRKKESMIARYEAELHDKIRELKERTADIQRLRGEVHKLRSVLQLKVCNEEGRPDILATIQETLPNNNAGDQRLKRQGVSGESYNNSGGFSSIELKHHEKDFR